MNKIFSQEVEKKHRARKRQGVRETSIVHFADMMAANYGRIARSFKRRGMPEEAQMFKDISGDFAQYADNLSRLEIRKR